MSEYLSLEKAKSILELEAEIVNFPPDPLLSSWLDRLETYFEHWLGYRMLPTLYREIVPTSKIGEATVSRYPVLSVVTVKVINNSLINQSAQAQSAKAVDPKQEGLAEFRTTEVSACRNTDYVVLTGLVNSTVEITYWAGYSPIPTMVEECLLFALTDIVKKGGLSWLFTPVRQVSSQSLPGGLSQSFKLGDFKQNESSYMDFYFSPLIPYQKRLFF